jgi:hypothetical protein
MRKYITDFKNEDEFWKEAESPAGRKAVMIKDGATSQMKLDKGLELTMTGYFVSAEPVWGGLLNPRLYFDTEKFSVSIEASPKFHFFTDIRSEFFEFK